MPECISVCLVKSSLALSAFPHTPHAWPARTRLCCFHWAAAAKTHSTHNRRASSHLHDVICAFSGQISEGTFPTHITHIHDSLHLNGYSNLMLLSVVCRCERLTVTTNIYSGMCQFLLISPMSQLVLIQVRFISKFPPTFITFMTLLTVC